MASKAPAQASRKMARYASSIKHQEHQHAYLTHRSNSAWGLGIACIIGLTACGVAEQPGGAPSQPVPQIATSAAAPSTALPATISAADLPTAMPHCPPNRACHPAANGNAKGDHYAETRSRPTNEIRPRDPSARRNAPARRRSAGNPPIAAPPAPVIVQTAQVEVAKADLARRRAVAPDTIWIIEVRDVTWPNPGLGCPQPGMAYKQVPVDGLLIRLESGGQLFEYHSGGSKAPFLCEQPAGGDKATPVSGGEGQ